MRINTNILNLVALITLLLCISSASAQLTMQKADGGILIVDGKQKVLKYQAETKSNAGEYERCNYIHPLWGMEGQVLTEDFPSDHLHHRGIFWAWHQVWVGNQRISNSWEIKNFEQDVVEFEFIKQPSGSVQIKTEVDWKSDKWKKSGIKVPYLKEFSTVTVHTRKGNYRKIDFEISLLALENNLKIGGSEDQKGYGGFSIRMALPKNVMFAGSEGIIEPEITAVQSDGFVNISGDLAANSKKGGIVLIDNPENRNYPQPYILRKKNSMQNIVFPGREAILISTTEPLVLKYSLIVYSGKIGEGKIRKLIN